MELFREVKIDWLGKKWYFLGFSLIFSVAGLLSLFFWHGLPLDVDFKGGTMVRVKFDQKPDIDHIRRAADRAGLKDSRIQSFGAATGDEVIITLAESQTSEAALDQGRAAIVSTLTNNYSATGPANQGKLDLDNAGRSTLAAWLAQHDPEHLGNSDSSTQHYTQQANAILDDRDNQHGGLFASIDNVSGVTTPAVANELKQDAYLSGFAVRNVEIVGPQVGAQLRKQALLATLYSLAGMLVYLWFRFELIYGVAAVVAVFHDTLITIGAFSLSNQEISLTVIAAILTLVGYSMNDTIVVFDRIRENLRMSRREPLSVVVNRSINQTLSRTVLTSGLTFLTVLSLYLFGGEVLHGFSFALVIGILIGTYSSIAVAAPMLVAYQDWRSGRGKSAVLPAAKKAKA
ncbi:preprotein translocase subunit SecF [Silvibacterium bohemicum]|uniref:Protein-export membrane protein SecF n=1 Tax=Silvibacterium bohemicum TaxID=1577686 RepID=A0A841K5A9_9BACT|nr:protein translocase subunit SecF [Silvibacterium bohemicum]MBB6145464.1 preprotein translocase subunit SecF [Silvibacterium bohemicum]